MTGLAAAVFRYPSAPPARRHGPVGYSDYKHYKPWLRDEFAFRCAYCLCRETWFPDGETSFGIDHVIPRRLTSGSPSNYDELVYACCACNAWKKDFPSAVDFGSLALAAHVEVQADGSIQARTGSGKVLIEVCALDRPELVAFRRDMRALLSLLEQHAGTDVPLLRRRYLGYPADLPQLAVLRPPGGNARPGGVARSFFELRDRGELPDLY